MPRRADASRLLIDAPQGRHFGQIHPEIRSTADACGLYVEEGLRRGQGVIGLITPELASRLMTRLQGNGLDPQACIGSGQLQIHDAESVLNRIVVGAWPDWDIFRKVIGSALEIAAAAGFHAPRVLGQLVQRLWQDGRRHAAIQLEEFWNRLASEQPFTLYCALTVDEFDPLTYEDALRAVARAHADMVFGERDEQLHHAIDAAAKEQFGLDLPHLAHRAREDQGDDPQLTEGQQVLLWLTRRMPSAAARLLGRVRELEPPELAT